MIRTFTVFRKGVTQMPRSTRRLPLLVLILVLHAGNIFAQTTWTGNLGTDWNTAGNWSAGVPTATSDVTIPNVTNDPVIGAAGAVAKSVKIASGGLLTVQAAASLAVNGSSSHGFVNEGTVNNSGTITVANVAGDNGIHNLSTFNNKTGGLVTIDNVVEAGLLQESGSFTNEGTLKVGSTGNVGSFGLNVAGAFNNTSTGQVTIDRAWYMGFSHYSGTTNNQGSISIGASAGTDIHSGINVHMGTFTNNGGQINIDRCDAGITGYLADGTFLNNGILKIGAVGSVPDMISNEDGILVAFNNNAGGVLQGTGNIPSAHFAQAGGTLSPGYSPGTMTFTDSEDFSNGTMSIEINGTGVAGTAYDQVVVNGTATLGGTLALSINYTPTVGDQVTILSASGISGTFSSVTGLPGNWTVKYTSVSVALVYGGANGNVWNGSVSSDWHDAANWSSGVPDANSEITIPDVANDPVIMAPNAVAKSVAVETGAVLTVTIIGGLTVNGATTQGVWNQGTIQNNGVINIGSTSNVGNYGIYNEGALNNNAGAKIKVNHVATSGIGLSSNTFTNKGEIIIGDLVPTAKLITAFNGQFNNSTEGVLKGTGEIAAANFTNGGGTLSPGYSPGTMAFTASENFSNNILFIEVNGKATPGIDFDRVNVSGTATLGGTLNLSINYTAAIGDQLVILSASQVTGTFASIVGIPAGWHVVYYPSTVVLTYGVAQTTWTGNVDTGWNNAANWSTGIPDVTSDVTIPDVANDPVIGSGAWLCKSVTISTGGMLTVESGASLTIQNADSKGLFNKGTLLNKGTVIITGSGSHGLVNEGTVNNSGTITVANVAGDNGIHNLSTFNNKTGGLVTIDNVVEAGLLQESGSFTNEGTLKVGSTGNVGSFGLNVAGAFNNTSTGQVTIDRAWYMGFSHYSGTTNNQGSISIGASAGTDIHSGINVHMGTFTNNGGQINIDRCDAGITGYLADGTFLNNGTLKIGAVGSVPDMISNEDGILVAFNNNAGGVLQGTGNIPSVHFAQAGGTLSPGYSPGTMTFTDSEDFSNGTMSIEINGTGVAGTAYDQVVVNGTATLGGVLALTFNFPAPKDGDLVTIIDATVLSGTFSSVTGLPEHWNVKYNSPNTGEVSLEYTNNLPVTLVRFAAKKQEAGIKLEWQTSEETNNRGFEIERGNVGRNWESIGFVDGSGTTKANSSYSFLDISPLPGMNYYRLRQIDFDGKTELSRIVGVRMDSEKVVNVFPNPTTGIINIEGAQSDVKVIDMLGRPVMKRTLVNQKLDISSLPTGFYIISVTAGNREKSISVLKQ